MKRETKHLLSYKLPPELCRLADALTAWLECQTYWHQRSVDERVQPRIVRKVTTVGGMAKLDPAYINGRCVR